MNRFAKYGIKINEISDLITIFENDLEMRFDKKQNRATYVSDVGNGDFVYIYANFDPTLEEVSYNEILHTEYSYIVSVIGKEVQQKVEDFLFAKLGSSVVVISTSNDYMLSKTDDITLLLKNRKLIKPHKLVLEILRTQEQRVVQIACIDFIDHLRWYAEDISGNATCFRDMVNLSRDYYSKLVSISDFWRIYSQIVHWRYKFLNQDYALNSAAVAVCDMFSSLLPDHPHNLLFAKYTSQKCSFVAAQVAGYKQFTSTDQMKQCRLRHLDILAGHQEYRWQIARVLRLMGLERVGLFMLFDSYGDL